MKDKITLSIALVVILFGIFSCKDQTTKPETKVETEIETKKLGGINLYTLREALKTNPKEVLKNVSDIGYKNIEDAGYADGKF